MKEEMKKRCHCGHGPAIQVVHKEKNILLNRLDPGSMSGMTTPKAFTLIELLVVVLIIGILAAVAVPQYQKAVNKARMTERMEQLRHIGQAEKMYYLANGSYTDDISLLGENVPTENTNWGIVEIDTRAEGILQIQSRALFLPYDIYLIYQLPDEKFYCSQGYNAKRQKICEGLYGSNGKIVDPTNSGFDMYPISQ